MHYSYIRRLIPFFAHIAYSLNALLQKYCPLARTTECDESFKRLMFLQTYPPVHSHFPPSSPTELPDDASGFGTEAAPVQNRKGGQHVIVYVIRTFYQS